MSEQVEVPKEEIEASRGIVAYFVQTPVEAYNLLLKITNELKTTIENTDGPYKRDNAVARTSVKNKFKVF